MAPKEKKTKAQIAAAAASGGKGKKKKWSKGKQKDKLNNHVFLDQKLHDEIVNKPPTGKYITPSSMSERYHINVSLARQVIKYLLEKEHIVTVGDKHSKQIICRRNVVAEAVAAAGEKKGKGGKADKDAEEVE
eukprot:GHVN01033784.1.p2 GENE.GHVN01033784.1~~GHVN01033784.1.p2  ORF type:complete len:133 (+),score=28.16 GHVN01033784.1:164-562(+)